MRLHPMRTKPARQPEAVSTSFEGQCNPREIHALGLHGCNFSIFGVAGRVRMCLTKPDYS
jgi:hypothetical protein